MEVIVQRDRAWRRFQAVRVGIQQVHILERNRNSPWVKSPHIFSKQSAMGCRCSKKTPGKPKVGRGICYCGAQRHSISLRRDDRRLVKEG